MKSIRFKDKTKILTESLSRNYHEYQIDDKVNFLSELLDVMPFGIINKGKTGFGATSLEINAQRNSIIVEPLKVTASTKTLKKENHLYVGSPTKKFPKKITNDQIKEFLSNDTLKHKKIICVSDSLERVINLIPKNQRKDYFLMIDESDSLQLDPNFRNTMERVIELYKTHPKSMRCLISATPIEFHDPELKDERRVKFLFTSIQQRKISVIYSDNPLGTTYERLKKIYEETSKKEKIVVAYNGVDKLFEIAEKLKTSGIPKEEISILCSQNSKPKAGSYYNELETEKLPTTIVLKTSAYFSGFDIQERYHLIIPIEPGDFLNSPSESRIQQIVGRCRKGLLSESLILGETSNDKRNKYYFEDLENEAKIQLRSLDCIHNNFKSSKLLKGIITDFYKSLIESSRIEGFNLIKTEESNSSNKISYLSIDAILELSNSKRTIYNTKNGLAKKLRKLGHEITETEESPETWIGNKPNNSEKLKITELGDFKKAVDGLYSSDQLKDFLKDKEKARLHKVFEILIKYGEFVDPKQLKELLIEKANNSKSLKNLEKSLDSITLDENSFFRKSLRTHFELEKEMTEDMIHEASRNLLTTMSILYQDNERKIKEHINCWVELKRKPSKLGHKYVVKGYNPMKINVLKFRTDNQKVNSLYQM